MLSPASLKSARINGRALLVASIKVIGLVAVLSAGTSLLVYLSALG